jgi:antitoxin (DNA-binding transcriptional repressor) of toxin-antitoxin stability system
MPAYSVAEAKTHLARLIDQVMTGQEVVITRHGRPVVELRATPARPRIGSPATYLWLRARRQARAPATLGSVQLIDLMYDPPA